MWNLFSPFHLHHHNAAHHEAGLNDHPGATTTITLVHGQQPGTEAGEVVQMHGEGGEGRAVLAEDAVHYQPVEDGGGGAHGEDGVVAPVPQAGHLA